MDGTARLWDVPTRKPNITATTVTTIASRVDCFDELLNRMRFSCVW